MSGYEIGSSIDILYDGTKTLSVDISGKKAIKIYPEMAGITPKPQQVNLHAVVNNIWGPSQYTEVVLPV